MVRAMTVIGLPALEARLAQDLAYLELPAKPWVPRRELDGRPLRDVVVVGAGMAGLAATAALLQAGIDNLVAYDAAPAGLEGPWVTFARMQTLRSPKQLSGPALGLPALTFRAWFEAQFGREAWERLGKIPRLQWMQYLVWYRRVLGLPVVNATRVTAVHPFGADALELHLTGPDGPERMLTRHLVLASGRDGLGGPYVPPVADGLDRRFWAHSADDIDFAALRGKRVGVVGASASAMDNAATALEAGAARVDLFVRRADIPRINKFTGIASPGTVHGFEALPDDWKWRLLHYAMAEQTPPPRDSTLRVSAFPQAHFHLGSPILALEPRGAALDVRTPKRRYSVDFLIFATGFHFDLSRRPELAEFAPYIRLWKHRMAAPPGLDNVELADSPDLAPDYAFTEREPGTCPALTRIHCFNHHASLSHGRLSGDIPAISDGAKRLALGLVRRLFVADVELQFALLQAFGTPELHGDEWTDADAPAAKTA